MTMALFVYLTALWLVGYANSENATTLAQDTCEPWDVGPWSALLEEWATSTPTHSGRHGRIMALPAANGYYVTERIDGFGPPPMPSNHMLPPNPQTHSGAHGPQTHSGAHGPPHQPISPPVQGIHVPQNYNEWEASPPTAGGKIVNRPPNPYKDKFKPSYAPPTPTTALRPQAGQRPAAERIDEHPQKQVSETDLYLLGAIEKLVYRVDLMEKRLRKAEESLHYLVAGTAAKPEPCPGNYTRVGAACYLWSREAADWQTASAACRRARTALLELREPAQHRALLATLLADKQLAGKDFWTGGLNPGLLWIWSHSARPVEGNGTAVAAGAVQGEGRCLALVHDPALRTYVYRGQDCALRHRYICQKEEDKTKLSNEIEKAARSLKLDKPRKSKDLWDDTD